MLFTERYRPAHARIVGLALMCISPISACADDQAPAPAQHDDSETSSSASISSRTRRSSGSSTSSSSSTTSSTAKKTKTVASCKSDCDDKGDKCKLACDEDDDDCNQACDDDRYACRKKCDKTSSSDAGDAATERDKTDAASGSRSTSKDAGVGASNASSASSASSMSVTIKFAARVGSADFACGQDYPDIGKNKTTVTPTDLRMFVQDVKLINKSGDEVPVELDTRKPWQSADVVLLDFEDGSGDCAEGNAETNTKITGKVPEDSYVGISFANGVPEQLNHEDPTTAPDPLSMYTDLSWGWLGGYIFNKVELREVTAATTFGTGLVHVGSTACAGKPQSGTVKCGKPNRNLVQLDDFDPKTNTIVFDVAAVFKQTDLTQMSECHSTGDFCAPMFEALGVDLATGKPLDKQSVFSVK